MTICREDFVAMKMRAWRGGNFRVKDGEQVLASEEKGSCRLALLSLDADIRSSLRKFGVRRRRQRRKRGGY